MKGMSHEHTLRITSGSKQRWKHFMLGTRKPGGLSLRWVRNCSRTAHHATLPHLLNRHRDMKGSQRSIAFHSDKWGDFPVYFKFHLNEDQ
jgi:hypothetical protein